VAAPGRIRPARYLLLFGAIVVVLYALVFGTGNHQPSPKLGIDLKGGTRVVLTARTLDGKPPTSDSLKQAKQIIEQRVNGIGVSGSKVVVQGDNIVITVPGDQGEQAKTLGETAKLNFRKVIKEAPGNTPAQQPQQGQVGKSKSRAPSGSSSGAVPSGTSPSGSSAPKPQGAPMPRAADNSGNSSPPSTSPPPSAQKQQNPGETAKSENAIAKARKLRQSKDKQTHQKALATLNCAPGHKDVLRGNSDPSLPLVTCGKQGNKFVLAPVFLKGTQVDDANATPNNRGAGFEVNLAFKASGSKKWADFTSNNVGKQAAIVLDTEVVSAPRIDSPILNGHAAIYGHFNQKQAQNLANVLKYGSLPLSFDTSNAQTVSATLGLVSLKAGLIAGAIGLFLVFLYCLLYYRALGVLTMASLILSFALVYAVLVLLGRWIGYSLDLSGVAGVIISIGVTADSFVVFFERLKDEVREGRSFRSAVPRSWVRARRTILYADAVVFLAAVVLYILAVGDVQGFAFTLGMSTLLDLVIVFLVTHPLVALASRSKLLSKPSLSGLGGVQRGLTRPATAGRGA
jgi:preprotein translocase subunit SecD